ncbi:hypothetical protein [Parashewanella curva]|uniref:hypothetical protein n=1 Tax=Parashewanella curva TaxID=2338552 RepID=UPI001A9E9088|nr:hypothetical protein [Parashewanella curva]
MSQLDSQMVPEGYKQTEIGVIPEDWEISLLSELCDVIDGDRGQNYPNANDFLVDGYCVFLSATNVTKKGFLFNNTSDSF